MNTFTITGTVNRKPVYRKAEGKRAVCFTTIAANTEGWYDQFLPIRGFAAVAEDLRVLEKGEMVKITGQINNVKVRDGYELQLVANKVISITMLLEEVE